jgi:hypothetical protein
MVDILGTLTDYFKVNGWNFDKLEERPVLRMGFKGEHAEWMCFAQARQEQQQAVFYSRAGFRVPEERRAAVAEFISRANYGMIIGNFELDVEDGEIRYKTSIDIEGGELSPNLIRNMVAPNVTMMDRYLPGVLAVAFGGVTPKAAIASIEAPQGNPGTA